MRSQCLSLSAPKFAAACVLACVGVLGCGGKAAAPTEQQHKPQPIILGVESVAHADVAELRTGPRISGTLEAREQASITAEVGGAVLQLAVELGQTVRRGQLLLRIDPGAAPDTLASAKAAVKSAEQALELARSQAERNRGLIESGALAENQRDVDQNAVASAAAQVEQANAQAAGARNSVSDSRVVAPMDGVISQQSVHEGDVVSMGAPLLRIIDPSSMRLEAAVPASALSELAIGTKVEFQVRADPDNVVEGSIARIAPAAEAATGLIQILVTIPNPSRRVLSGLFADGRIALEAKQALAIPVTAVDRTSEPPQVTRIRDGRADIVQIKLGLVDEQQELVEVESGLQRGDYVALGTAREIASGTPVKLVGVNAPGRAAGPASEKDRLETAQRKSSPEQRAE